MLLNVNRVWLAVTLTVLFHSKLVSAQTSIAFNFVDDQLTKGVPIKLEAFEYRPSNWNGKVILMSHGSTGGKADAIKASTKFLNISREAMAHGYIFVPYMRKGRGNSEGVFTEETGRCDKGNLTKEKKEAEDQLTQVIEQTRSRYGVSKVILMGHSRGGYLSATYAAKYPDSVIAVVNLAGAWSAICETKNGGLGRLELEESARNFKPQFWAYFDQDTYFGPDRFNDPDYRWLSETAERHAVRFVRFGNEGMADGHATPTFKPAAWARSFFPQINQLK